MNLCSYCGSDQEVGALFCDECGQYLAAPVEQPETQIVTTSSLGDPPSTTQRGRKTGPVAEQLSVTLEICSSGRRITIQPDEEIRIGRVDPQAGEQPDLDLTTENGAELGVSRIHAFISSSDRGVILVDLDSTNGTRLNDHSLTPQRSYVLHDGDEIQFGRLLVEVAIE